MIDRLRGIRWMQTFKKLPTRSPKRAAQREKRGITET
jgi:hypothetical protein